MLLNTATAQVGVKVKALKIFCSFHGLDPNQVRKGETGEIIAIICKNEIKIGVTVRFKHSADRNIFTADFICLGIY